LLPNQRNKGRESFQRFGSVHQMSPGRWLLDSAPDRSVKRILMVTAGLIAGAVAMSLYLTGCEICSGGASYFFPTEWIGVKFETEQDAENVRQALAAFAQKQRRRVYRPIDEPFFAEQNLRDPYMHLERYTHYDPPGRCTGWAVTQIDHAPDCMIVMVSDRSGSWTHESLEAVRQIERLLANVAAGKVAVLVRAKPQQNYPAQIAASETDLPPSELAPCEWRTQFEVPEPTPP